MASHDAARTVVAVSGARQTRGSRCHQRRVKGRFKCPEQRKTVPTSYANTKKPSPDWVMVMSECDWANREEEFFI